MDRNRLLSSPSLFDAAIHGDRDAELAEQGFDVVARPGAPAPARIAAGTMVLRRAHAEGRLTILAAARRMARGRASMESLGVACEGYGEGIFVEVDEGPGPSTSLRAGPSTSLRTSRRAWRIAGPEGLVVDDTVLLRSRVGPGRARRMQVRSVPRVAEDVPSSRAMLLAAVYSLRGQALRPLRQGYVRLLFEPQSGTSPLDTELQRAIADLDRRSSALPAGAARAAAQQSLLAELARPLLSAAERHFILDERRSILELLEPSERDRYLGFAWHPADFPGGPKGPNEDRAEQMFAALTRLRPERRANQGEAAAVRASEFDSSMQARLSGALIDVSGERGMRLHRDAAAAYERMRSAATAEGVSLAIANAYREPAVAQASASRAGNRLAVASFSSHTLGLAVDLKMSHGGLRFAETSTRPFPNLVGMYRSPIHKWMFLRAEPHGWFPYRREPWHWEYNPTGFRERLRSTPNEAASAAQTESDEQAVADRIAAIRPPLAISGSVGRGGRNAAADVLAVQQRLIELRALDQNEATAERPSGTTAEASLPRTIEAIERIQGAMGTAVDGKVDVTGVTRTDLDRAIPTPTAADFTTVSAERAGVRVTVRRGLTLTGPVGSTASGNGPDDVRAVQRRLVDLGRLAASHRESPAAAASAVSQEQLRATIQALRAVQSDVRFWVSKGVLTGAVTPGVAAPGDATAAFLDRVSAYSVSIGTHQIAFHDHVASHLTVSETGIMFVGTALPSSIPVSDYRTIGLSADQAAALTLVSSHESNFDAVNTYDRALVSAGFIQFAGSRGLPGYLALLKARHPAKFAALLQAVGIDVEFTVSGGVIRAARIIVLDPASSSVLRAAAAESAIRNDKALTAALIVSGRDRDVQRTQIEAAVRDYVRPALDGAVSWAAGASARLGQILRSRKGMAALFDRAIQEGVVAARGRFERLLQRMVRGASTPPSLAEMQRREGDVLSELERDLQAAADVAAGLTRARSALQTLITAAGAAGATVTAVLARPELAAARRMIEDARSGLAGVVNVAPSHNVTVDATLTAITATLSSEHQRLALTPSPSSLEALTSTLTASRQALTTVAGPVATAPMFLARVQRIRRSTLDSGLTEAV